MPEATIHDVRHPLSAAMLRKRLGASQTAPSDAAEGQARSTRRRQRRRRGTQTQLHDAALLALRRGQTGQIGVPELVLRNHRDRADDLAAVFAPCPTEGGLLDEFRGARGYAFSWGHIIEDPVNEDGARHDHEWTIWYFYVEEVWRAAMMLDARNAPTVERSFLDGAVDMYMSEVAAKLPGYLRIRGGLSYDLFAIAISTLPGDAGTKDAERARRWLAKRFVPHILPRITTRVLDSLSMARIDEARNRGRDIWRRAFDAAAAREICACRCESRSAGSEVDAAPETDTGGEGEML